MITNVMKIFYYQASVRLNMIINVIKILVIKQV